MHTGKLFKLMAVLITIMTLASPSMARDKCGRFKEASFTMNYWHTTASQSEKNAYCQCQMSDLKKIDPNATVVDCVKLIDLITGESVQNVPVTAALALALAAAGHN